MTCVINLYGGPGTGKSTTAAHLFALLKLQGFNAELVTEYAKELVWTENYKVFGDQIYIFAEQLHRISRLIGKVEFIVVDSPVLLSLHYGANESEAFKTLVLEQYSKMDNLDIFLQRVKPYNPSGRRQDEESAKSVDVAIRDVLDANLIDAYQVTADENAAQTIFNLVLAKKIANEKQI